MRTRRPSCRNTLALAVAACTAPVWLAWPQQTQAATLQWLGGSGSWADFTHWSGGFLPTTGFDTLLGVAAAPTPSVTVRLDDFSYVAAGSSINRLTVNSTGILGTFTLLQDRSDSDMVATLEVIGDTVSGNAYVHSAGRNVTGFLLLGQSAGGVGRYELSGSAQLQAGSVNVGQFGQGSFAQSGGTLDIAQHLQVAAAAGGSGYALSGGTVNLASGGFVQIVGGGGHFDHSGGTLNFAGNSGLVIGPVSGAGGADAYTLTGTGVLQGAAFELIGTNGSSGIATFVQLAGVHTLAAGGVLTVGDSAGGIYRMSGGELQTSVLQLGAQGGANGVFALTGGVVTLAPGGSIDIGKASAANGTFSAFNGIGQAQLSAPNIRVGVAGSGNFSMGNGASVSANTVVLADAALSNGSFTISSGSLLLGSATTAGALNVGGAGTGSLLQTAGTVSLRGAAGASGYLQLGLSAGSQGTYALKGGTLSADQAVIGAAGLGTFVQSGGNVTLAGAGLFVACGASGAYGLSTADGPATLSTTVETIGCQGSGVFSQTGSAQHHVTQALRVGSVGGGQGSFTMAGGTLDTPTLRLGGGAGSGQFTQTAGSVLVGGALNIFARSSYTLSGGTLAVGSGSAVGAGGNFVQSGGQFNGTLTNGASVTYSAGDFAGRLVNDAFGTLTLNATLIAGQGVVNLGSISVGRGLVLGSGAAGTLDNRGTLTLAGGALDGAGAMLNSGSFGGFGTVAGSGGYTNSGLWTINDGTQVLGNTGVNTNLGLLNVGAGRQLQLAGATLVNRASISLHAGVVSGVGMLVNAAGGTLGGTGGITTDFSNQGVVVPGAGALLFARGFANGGVVNLGSPQSSIGGGAITNTGTLQGQGSVGAAVNNGGTVEALGGALIFTQALENTAGGRISAGAGAKVLAQGGLPVNQGLVALGGGNLDAAGPVLNQGQITGWGSLSTGGLRNDGKLTLTGGVTMVNGTLTNGPLGQVQVSYNPVTFTGAVVNNGSFQTLATTVVFAGGFINNGVLASDPATLRFSDLSVGAAGVLTATAGDRYEVSGSFSNLSAQAQAWNTLGATLLLASTGPHALVLAGLDLGADPQGYQANFAWGRVELASGAALDLQGAQPAGALYTGAFVLDGGLSQLGAVRSSANIYYNPGLAENAYLQGSSYALPGGGQLAPVPEPGSGRLGLLGLAVGGLLRRRRRAASLPAGPRP